MRSKTCVYVSKPPCCYSLPQCCWTVCMSEVTMCCSLMGVWVSISAEMNSKHLHYSRKPARLKMDRRKRVCPAQKMATRDLTCNKAWSNKKHHLPATPTIHTDPCKPSHIDTHRPAQAPLFKMFILLICSTPQGEFEPRPGG